jgi:hypothetical protein
VRVLGLIVTQFVDLAGLLHFAKALGICGGRVEQDARTAVCVALQCMPILQKTAAADTQPDHPTEQPAFETLLACSVVVVPWANISY